MSSRCVKFENTIDWLEKENDIIIMMIYSNKTNKDKSCPLESNSRFSEGKKI